MFLGLKPRKLASHGSKLGLHHGESLGHGTDCLLHVPKFLFFVGQKRFNSHQLCFKRCRIMVIARVAIVWRKKIINLTIKIVALSLQCAKIPFKTTTQATMGSEGLTELVSRSLQ